MRIVYVLRRNGIRKGWGFRGAKKGFYLKINTDGSYGSVKTLDKAELCTKKVLNGILDYWKNHHTACAKTWDVVRMSLQELP